MIKFIKILAYELRPKEGDVFDYVAGICSQEINPTSLQKGELIPNTDIVLYSSLRRAEDCLKQLPHVQYIPMTELKEISFNLKKMCTRSEWNTYGSEIVRKRFKEMFLKDELLIPRKQIFTEIKIVLDRCKQLSSQSITVVSHSFKMKLVEAFIKTHGEIEAYPELIEDFIKDTEKTYEFGAGFEIQSL